MRLILKMTKLLGLLFLIGFAYSCATKLHDEFPKERDLDSYYHELEKPIGELLACGCLEFNAGEPILTTIFYPHASVDGYQLFMTDTTCYDKNDLSHYYEIPIQIDSLFKGKLLRVDQKVPNSSVFVKVVGVSKDSLFISDAIKVSSPISGTERDQKLITIDTLNEQMTFRWDKKYLDNSKVFLTLVGNKEGDLRSCSYTKNNYFQLDDPTAADRIIYPLDKQVKLESNTVLLWMSVNNDNWITHLAQIPFKR